MLLQNFLSVAEAVFSTQIAFILQNINMTIEQTDREISNHVDPKLILDLLNNSFSCLKQENLGDFSLFSNIGCQIRGFMQRNSPFLM